MNTTDKHFFADADTPFHVWVRESCGAHGWRWVLRHVSQVIDAATCCAAPPVPVDGKKFL